MEDKNCTSQALLKNGSGAQILHTHHMNAKFELQKKRRKQETALRGRGEMVFSE
jgi:hypothetical protein